MQAKPTLLDRLCFYAYVYVLPRRWQFTRLGFWLLERAGNFAYWDNDRLREAIAVEQEKQHAG